MPKADDFWDRLKGIWVDDWREDAACAGLPPELFENPEMEELGKSICSTCPVRIECLDDALYYGDEDFVRGGLSYQEQVTVKRHHMRYAPHLRHDLQELDG